MYRFKNDAAHVLACLSVDGDRTKDRNTHKQLKAAAVNTLAETQHSVMFIGSNLNPSTGSKGFSSKY